MSQFDEQQQFSQEQQQELQKINESNEDYVPSLSPGSSDLTQETSDFGGDQSLETKPAYSYASLISQAINSTPEKKMTLNNIYAWISSNFSYYKANDSGWQNSIRHNLSLNKCFVKVQRTDSEPGKGAFWAIDPSVKDMFDMNTMRKKRTRAVPPTSQQQQQQQQNHQHYNDSFVISEDSVIDPTSTVITPLTTSGTITTITLNNSSSPSANLVHPPKKRRMSQPSLTSPIKKSEKRKFSLSGLAMEVPRNFSTHQRASPVPVFKLDHLSFFPTSSLFQQQKAISQEKEQDLNISLEKSLHIFDQEKQEELEQYLQDQNQEQQQQQQQQQTELSKNNRYPLSPVSLSSTSSTITSTTLTTPSFNNSASLEHVETNDMMDDSQQLQKLGDLDWSGNSVLNNEEIFLVQECEPSHTSDVWNPILV